MPIKSLVELCRSRAQARPEQTLYRFTNGESVSGTLTFSQLDAAARTAAAFLRERARRGDRVLLMLDNHADFVRWFFGCQYAGMTAVPMNLPSTERQFLTTHAIARNSGAQLLLTGDIAAKRLADAPLDCTVIHVHSDGPSLDESEPFVDTGVSAADAAFLQYTSGSTGTPKGVVVSQGNIVSNLAMIQRGFDMNDETVVLGWLPFTHDMGLVGLVLEPLHLGASSVLMPPSAFVRRPARWLKSISEYRATVSGGPDFGYAMCVRRVDEAELEGVDLSSWRLAFNGAETVRRHTIESFSAKFARCGFASKAFYPCYGLAEATLFVTGPAFGSPISQRLVAASDLEAGVVRPQDVSAADEPRTRELVASGQAWTDVPLCIADPQTLQPRMDGEIGEILVGGTSVAQGYWNSPEQTARTFGVYTSDGAGPYLRTGDLGFLDAGQLYVTGRIKDLLIVSGKNHYPQDLELTASQSDPEFLGRPAAAFLMPDEREEAVALVQEVSKVFAARYAKAPQVELLEQLKRKIRDAVAKEHGVALKQVVLVQQGELPMTTSGKIRRSSSQQLLLNRQFNELGAVQTRSA